MDVLIKHRAPVSSLWAQFRYFHFSLQPTNHSSGTPEGRQMQKSFIMDEAKKKRTHNDILIQSVRYVLKGGEGGVSLGLTHK